MKQGSMYAVRLKKVYARLRNHVPRLEVPEGDDDPVYRLSHSIFAERWGDMVADRAIKQLLTRMVDWNEARVSSSAEIQAALGVSGEGVDALCERLRTALHWVFQREHRLSLDRLRNMGRRDARQLTEQIPGAGPYCAAAVTLWSLAGHAVPVDDPLLERLRKAELVHPEATREDVQAFLERHVSAADVRDFCVRMRTFDGVSRSPTKAKKSQGLKSGKSKKR